MRTQPRLRSVFHRLETDSELRRRLISVIGNRSIVYLGGEQLDDVAWQYAKLQRRIVEDHV